MPNQSLRCQYSVYAPPPRLFFSVEAAGAYRQVTAPLTQRRGSEELHEYFGESGAER